MAQRYAGTCEETHEDVSTTDKFFHCFILFVLQLLVAYLYSC